jgi:alkanesulfonate monooxygenase SsuD/methylene tetrahydromethanopterin reductase-like flavin-dependent oxidoreductase (luciferase family)
VHPRPVQSPHPPLWVAGVVDAAVDRAARLGDAWLCGPVQSLARAKRCLETYHAACSRLGRKPDWILRRYAWIGTDRRKVMEDVLPRYVDGLMIHWRESAEDPEEKALFARIDAGENVTPQEIAGDRLLFGDPDDVIGQIERYRRETGCEHVHAAFGAGMPAHDTEYSTLGDFEAQAEMIRLFGKYVIPHFRR